MNILIVCQEIPYPLNAGYKIRTFNLIKCLSRNNSISLICSSMGDNAEDSTAAIYQYCKTIKIVTPRIDSKIKQMPNILKNMFAGQPICVKYVKSTAMKTVISEIVSTRCFDLIHFDDPYIASNYDFNDNDTIKKTVTFHDIDSYKFRRIYKIETNIRKKIMLLLDMLLVRRWEQFLVKKADLCIVMSHNDAHNLKANGNGNKITVIPNGVDTEKFKFSPLSKINDTVSFFGNMDYLPNQDAVFYFYQQILPIISSIKPDVKFIIVGRNPNLKLLALTNDPRVIVTGSVDDVIPYYLKSSVAVVPLRAGGGTRLKILEAMAVGCPIVSTSIGSEGLDVTHGKNIMIADTTEKFADLTVELMTNATLREKLSITARKFVEKHYVWEGIADNMSKTYEKIYMS